MAETWSLEGVGGRFRSLLVVCPKCGRVGRLYYSRGAGWYVKHGSRITHSVRSNVSLEIPLHEPRLNLVKFMGGDSLLLPYLAKMIPPHTVYVEVFGGGAPLLLNKPPSKIEVYNDIDGNLVNLFRVVRDNLDAFLDYAKWVLYSRETYYEFLEKLHDEKDPVKRAVMYFAVLRMSVSGVSGRGGFGTSRCRNEARRFSRAIEKLWLVKRRLENVVIESLDFRECIRKYDGKQTFMYLDPPHLYYATEKEHYYTQEFTENDFTDLLSLLESVKCRWLLKQTHIPYIIDWARRHGYSYTTVEFTKMAGVAKGHAREKIRYVFVANYKL